MKSFWKYFVVFLVIIILVGGGFFVWSNYLSPAAKYQRQIEKQYQSYLEWEEQYKEAMRQDTYGGKTPEETLQMFIEALKKGDIELASKYFALNTNENSEYYLTRREAEDGLKRAKDSNSLTEIIDALQKMQLANDTGSTTTARYVLRDENGVVERSAFLELDKYSGVWKIESL